MENTSEFKTKDSSNVTVLHSQNRVNSDIMKLKGQEDGDMEHGMYTKTEIDLKLDKISSDTQHGFEKVDLKFDQLRTEMRDGFENMGLRMEKMFSDFKLEQQKEKEENKKWLIALTVGSLLSIIGIAVSIIAILFQK
jgi:hypothetical protein|nr:MAG TPA: HCMV UL42 [Caudoviricetes sp.]